ncbi:MAG: adenylate kinase [Candidatus Paracaedibacteraceae bacterium]|nr:adenylate kinase [Candidatus Paracaedibacteraceae bacterium]
MKHLIILGAPGSGKGTQSKKLEEKYRFKLVSTGDLLRAEVASGSEVGNMCADIMAQGRFPENKIIYQLVEKFLSENAEAKGILYDGFPRTIEQAEFLLDILKQRNETVNTIINVQVDKDALIKRIVGRFSCADCGEIYNQYYKVPKMEGTCDVCSSVSFKTRSDDTEDTVKTRLTIYEEATAPVVDFFINHKLNVVVVDGMRSVDNVFHQIESVL